MSLRAIFLLAVLWCCTGPTHAQDFNHGCTGYIDSLPATIVKPGTWCLRRNMLAPAGGSLAALTILADDVTIDCRGFRIRAIPGGAPSQKLGISSIDRNNTTVRGCKVRGFWGGILLGGERGLVVQDNLVEDSAYIGIYLDGRASTISGNTVVRTGGTTDLSLVIGIHARGGADVMDNTIVDLSPPSGRTPAQIAGRISMVGIFAVLNAGSISRNRIRQETTFPPHRLIGIQVASRRRPWSPAILAIVHHNDLIGPGGTGTEGIDCFGSSDTLVAGNMVNGFATGVDDSCTSQDNHVLD